MLAVGLQGSPNDRGSTVYLLKRFMDELAARGVRTRIVDVAKKNIRPCRGCGYCEKKGFCVIDDDDMAHEIYALLREAELVVAASPVFFYGITSQLKALVDRSQTLWSRKYRFKLSDPLKNTRKGFLLSMGGSRGKQLFEGVSLVAQYFFDAVDAEYCGSLTYRNIERREDLLQIAELDRDIVRAAASLLSPLASRKKVVFAGQGDACRSQMAGAFAQHLAGKCLDVATAGLQPLPATTPFMVQALAEKGLDVAFRSPRPLAQVMEAHAPDVMVFMDEDPAYPAASAAQTLVWKMPAADTSNLEQIRSLRDRIETNVKALLKDI